MQADDRPTREDGEREPCSHPNRIVQGRKVYCADCEKQVATVTDVEHPTPSPAPPSPDQPESATPEPTEEPHHGGG